MSKASYHHGNLRPALVEAATSVLADNGVAGLSLRRVAQEAGVSATALYSHFKDKRELLAVLATGGYESLAASMLREASVLDQTDDETQFSLLALAHGYILFAIRNSAIFHLMFGQELGRLSDFPELATTASRSYAMMASSVARQLEANGSQADAAVAATAAWAMVHGLATLIIDGRVSATSCGADSTEAMIQQVCQTLTF